MFFANYHTHTTFCDGNNSAQEMVEAALELGLDELGFSGHMDPGVYMDWELYSKEIKRLQELYRGRIDILLGAELDCLFDPKSCEDAEYVIGSTHYVDCGEEAVCIDDTFERMKAGCDKYFGGDWYALAKAYYELEAHAYERTNCTMIGHFDLVVRFNDEHHFLDENDKRYLTPAKEAMANLVQQGVPFEINCGAFNRGRKAELYPRQELLKELHDLGGRIFINSDAHSTDKLTSGFEQAKERALAAGFESVLRMSHDASEHIVLSEVGLASL